MKRNVLMALVGAALLCACSQKSGDDLPQNTERSLGFSMKISKVSTRTVEAPVKDQTTLSTLVLANFDGLNIQLINAAGNQLGNNLTITPAMIADLKAGKKILFNNIDPRAVSINVSFNSFVQTNINDLQNTATKTDMLTKMEYVGQAQIDKPATTSPTVNPDNGNVIWEASVAMTPTLSRFEAGVSALDLKYKAQPALDLAGTTEAAFKAATARFSDAEILVAKQVALDRLNAVLTAAAMPTVNLGSATFTFDLAYSQKYNGGRVTSIDGVYLNNFLPTRSAAARILYANNGAGDWNTEATDAYLKTAAPTATQGIYQNMWDNNVPRYTGPGDQVNGFNLFPQSASSTTDLAKIKDEMPHVILSLWIDHDNNGATPDIRRWLTIRAFSNQAGGALISTFEAGKAYFLNGADIELDWIVETMTVTATANGETGTSDPDPKDDDKTNENPEPKDIDLRVVLTIKDWETVFVNPVW